MANLVKGDWVKKDSIIIDVGINKVGDKLVGDVDFESVKDKGKSYNSSARRSRPNDDCLFAKKYSRVF